MLHPQNQKSKIFPVRLLCVVLTTLLLGSMLSGCGALMDDLNRLYDMLGIFQDSVKETDELTTGVDVARYQGTIDWQQAAESGLDFAMVRLGYRAQVSGEIVEDANARYNMQEAAKYGIRLGAYFFSTAVSEKEAREEAAWVADLVAQYPITYPIAYNCEGFLDPENRQHGLTARQRTDIALAFLDAIEEYGYEAMFYASKNDMQDNAHWITTDLEKNYKIWVAQYPDVPYPATAASTYPGEHQMWQYTTSGRIPGIPQGVDCNVAYFGYDGTREPRDPNPPAPVEADVEAMLNFREVNEQVTAKEETNLRSIPGQGEDSVVLFTLHNGEAATRIAVCDSGWSKLLYNETVCYAVSNLLTTDVDGSGQNVTFHPVSDRVTPKEEVNLRTIPSTENEDSRIVVKLRHGEYVDRIGVSDSGWSQVLYEGQTCYAVTRFLETGEAGDGGIQTQFEAVSDQVTPKKEVNLRTIPSVEDEDSQVVVLLKHGEIVTRTGINRDLGWSRVEYNGQELYCITSYLEEVP